MNRALLLTPGAGAGRDQPSLVAIEDALAPIPVERIDFPYRLAGRKSPDKPEVLMNAVRASATALAIRTRLGQEQVALGGRSMGGRMCSMVVAEGFPALALVLVSYPLHPPGKPERARTDHFPSIDVPCLFVSGTRDAFGRPDELETATKAIRGPVTHVWVEGKGHDLRGAESFLAETVSTWVRGLRG